jgi:hypothetical protein
MWNCYEELQLLIHLNLALIGAKQYKKRLQNILKIWQNHYNLKKGNKK